MLALCAKTIEQCDQLRQRNVFLHARRVTHDAEQTVLGDRTARPPGAAIVGKPVVSDVVVDVTGVNQRHQDVDIQQRDQATARGLTRLHQASVQRRQS